MPFLERHMIAVLVLLVGVVSGSARAQSVIVNSQSMDLSARAPDWSAQGRLSAAYAAGNVRKLNFGLGLKVQHQSLWPGHGEEQAPWLKERWMIIGSLAAAKAGGKAIENQGLVHLRWTRMWFRRWGHEVFFQSRYNEFLRLKHREVAGGGVRFDALNRNGWLGWMGSAYMFEFSSINQDVEGDTERTSVEHRWSSYLALRKSAFEDRFLAQLSAFVQPRFDQFSDLRAFATLELSTKIGEHFGLGITGAFAYDARPPAQVESADLRLLSTLTFQR